MSNDQKEIVSIPPAEKVISEEEKSENIKQEGDEFIVVNKRKGRKDCRRGKRAEQNFHNELKGSQPGNDSVERSVIESRGEVLRKISLCIDNLRESKYYNKIQEHLDEGFTKVIGCSSCPNNLSIFCLGLGPFSSHLLSRIARYQLALLILLKEKYGVSAEIFDPVFIPQERSILTEDFEIEVSTINEEGKHRIESPTLIYMPHCPHQLVNNFLFANWTPESLANCYILCNSLSEALVSIPSSYVKKNLSFLLNAHSICEEIPVPNIFSDQPDVFNDIALHVFPTKNFTSLSEDFWMNISEPSYTEEDFVSSESINVRNSDTWKYIMEIARRNRLTSLQNCQEGSEWPRIAETYLMYTQSSRIYGDMIEQTKQSRGGTTIMDAIKAQSKASSALFELKRRKPRRGGGDKKDDRGDLGDDSPKL
ncbi:SRR1-like protein [Orchesella cincta]|uniref:SRR1-like protein n=1 Tax=Orchesella cincta TaxID=48709 RepID=A0A1D2MRJ9_ORCCI|nr:SRR1-like protein [Orchesella cincta]